MDQDLAILDQSILPLHLRKGAICSKEEAHERRNQNKKNITGAMEDEDEEEEVPSENFEWKDDRSKFKIFLSHFLGHEDLTEEERHERPEPVLIEMDNWQFAVRIYPCAAWSFVITCLMFLFLARYFTVIESDGQRLQVLKMMSQTEVKVAAALAPAFRAVSALAFAAKAGVLNTSSPYTSLSNIMAPEFYAGSAIQFVQVVGAGDYTTLLRRGNISAEELPTRDRQLLVFAANQPCQFLKKDPMLCMTLNNSELIDVPRDAAAMRWQRPSYLAYDGTVPYWLYPDERIDPIIQVDSNMTMFAHRLVAFVDARNTTGVFGERGPRLAVEVAIDLSNVFSVVREAVPEGGETYVCTTDGTVIAGSNYMPQAQDMYDPAEAMMVYPRLWDLGLNWVKEVTPAMVAERKQSEGWSDSDIVVTRPLAVGDTAGASYRLGLADLRIVSTAPRTVGTSSMFKSLVHGAMGVMGAPGVFLFMFLVALGVHAIIMCVANFIFNRLH
jgi:hypothetical protein